MCGRCCQNDLLRLDTETTNRFGHSSGSSTIAASLRSKRAEKSVLSCSSLPPYDSTHTAYYSVLSGDEPQVSSYEQLLHDQGYLPRLEDQYDWSGRAMHVAYDANDDIPLVARYTLGISGTAIVEAVQCRGRLLARKSMRFTRRVPLETMIPEVGLLQELRHRHIVQVVGSYTQRRNLSILAYPVADCTLEAMMYDVESNELVPRLNGQSVRDQRLALK